MGGASTSRKLTVAEFIAWAEAQGDDRRYELLNGEIVAQASPMRQHGRLVGGMFAALDAALPAACEVIPATGVRIGDDTALEPDLTVFCGERPEDNSRYGGDPVIVVEILSPSTTRYDMGGKREAYQKLDSLEHYLIVHPEERFVLIHSAGPERDWSIVSVAREDFRLDPPGALIPYNAIFARLRGA